MKNCWLIFALLLLTTCTQTTDTDNKAIHCNPNDWSKETTNIGDLIDDFEIIPLETTENNVIGLVGQIEVMNDNLMVSDKQSRKIFAFDRQGNFKHAVGKVGKGPGEYVSFSGFTTTPDKSALVVNYMEKRSLMYYSPDGNFIKMSKVPIKGHLVAFINDSTIAVHSGRMGYNGDSESYFELWMTNELGKVIDSLFNYHEALLMDYGYFFIPSYEKGSILYTKMADYNIYKLSEDQLDTLYRFDFGAANLDTSFYLKAENYNKLQTLSNKIKGINAITNTKAELLASFTMDRQSNVMVVVNSQTKNHKCFFIDSIGMGYYKGIPVPIPRWADETHRYCQIPAYLWQTIVSDLSDNQKEMCRNEIKGFRKAEEASENDNPIIFKFKLKDF